MRKIKTKQIRKQNIKNLLKNEWSCGCNCCICNPYYGDFWKYFIEQDKLLYKNTEF